ncbi:hypothetical protein kuro4_05530 [Gelria sp. Kuro-4]|nr:hypothetical protein kuro4_05530 [Gelria sp. Kuro-4]
MSIGKSCREKSGGGTEPVPFSIGKDRCARTLSEAGAFGPAVVRGAGESPRGRKTFAVSTVRGGGFREARAGNGSAPLQRHSRQNEETAQELAG